MSVKHGTVSSADTIERLASWFEDRFANLRVLANELTATLNFDSEKKLNLSASARRAMKEYAAHYLQQHPVIDGCGMIFAHSALGTEAGHLEWWVREDETRFARYSFGVVPGADRYYDYEQHEWFTRAFEEGRSAAVGPYIDYLGVEVYIVTLTVPAIVEGRRVGAVGNDMQVDDIERALLPILLACDCPVALLTRHGTVLVSNTPDFLPGELVQQPDSGYRFVPLAEVTDGMHLMIGERA